MQWLLRRIYSVRSMLSTNGALGELPSTKQAYRDVLQIAIPSVLEMVLMSLVGFVDTMMVSKMIVGVPGSHAIAAVGLVGQPRMLVLAIFFAINVGVTSIVARRKGEGRQEEANKTLRNAIVMIMGLTVVVMALALGFSRQLMGFAGAQPETIDLSNQYFRILTWFLPVNALTICICAAQRGVGNTRITMYVNITSNLVNVVFNYMLIGGRLGFPALGVEGAAYATVIGYCVGLVMCVATIIDTKKRNSFLRFSKNDDWRIDKQTMLSITNIGGSAMLEQIAMRIGFFMYAKIVASLGTNTFAAHQICMQFLNISFCFGDGISVAGTSLVGQMLGKKRPDLSVIYGKAAQRMSITAAFLIASVIILLREPLVSWLITSSDAPEVFTLATKVMFIVAMFQPLQMSSVVISGALRGAGDTKYVAKVMMTTVACIRPLLALVVIYVMQNVFHRPDIALMGAWSASFVDMSVRLALVYRRFNGGKWHEIAI